MMIESNRASLNQQLTKVYNHFVTSSDDIQFLTRDVDVDPTLWKEILSSNNEFDLSRFSGRDFFVLTILSWYMPEWAQILLRIQIEEEWNDNMSELKSAMLSSKEMMLSILQIQEYYNGFDLFGNILGKKSIVLKKIGHFFKLRQPQRSKPKKPIRKRGYTDKGSRRPEHQPEPRYKDYTKLLTVGQYEERIVSSFILQQQWVDRAIENLQVA